MTATAWNALLPWLALGLTPIAVMVAIAMRRSHRAALWITVAGFAVALARVWPAARVAPVSVTPLLRVDGFALFFTALIAGAGIVTALFAGHALGQDQTRREEFYVLLGVAALGAATLAASAHFASFFLGLETLSVALYGLAAYPQRRALPLEAGIKYLVLAAASAAFLLLGMALIYTATGALDFARLAGALPAAPPSLVVPGAALILVGIGFKLGLVPFHLWTPDVYQGAPAAVGGFIATASKAGVFAVLMRFFFVFGGLDSGRMVTAVAALAVASMIGGNLLALRQGNLKRLLGYSSIAHMGYLLVAVLAARYAVALATATAGFYFLAYFVTTLAAFDLLAALTSAGNEPESLADLRGLFWRRPFPATVLAAAMLSLAGIPLTAGFFAKFYLVAAGAVASLWLLLLVLIVTSVIGLFYYLRVVLALFAAEETATPLARLPAAQGWLLGVLLAALIWIGVYPQPFLRMILGLPLR
jgi:NADH-quinone oxidoreductase subunit N